MHHNSKIVYIGWYNDVVNKHNFTGVWYAPVHARISVEC